MTEMPQTISMTWTSGFAGLEPLFAEWQDLADRTGSDVFLSPLWFRVWWDQMGAGRPLHCLVARQDGRLVGLLPFVIDILWLGPLPRRIARLAGSDPHCMVFTLPVAPELVAAMLACACADLLATYRCHAVSFTPVSERAAHLDPLRALAGPGLVVTDQVIDSHVVFDLPATFDLYLAKMLSKSRRSQFRQNTGKLRADYAMTDRNFVPTAAEFDDFVSFHTAQWNLVGKGGHFSDWPGSADFFRALSVASRPGYGVDFTAQSGSFGPLFTQFALLSGQTCHWRLPARSIDPRAEHLSMGNLGMGLAIQHLIAAGVTLVEGGRGKYDYKLAYGGVDVPVHRILVSRSAPKLLLAWADLVEFCYYRVWFKKLAPKLRQITGAKARPLWNGWIRSRL